MSVSRAPPNSPASLETRTRPAKRRPRSPTSWRPLSIWDGHGDQNAPPGKTRLHERHWDGLAGPRGR
eukprot:11187390-Lingulodinium_polyedra.AAC.1